MPWTRNQCKANSISPQDVATLMVELPRLTESQVKPTRPSSKRRPTKTPKEKVKQTPPPKLPKAAPTKEKKLMVKAPSKKGPRSGTPVKRAQQTERENPPALPKIKAEPKSEGPSAPSGVIGQHEIKPRNAKGKFVLQKKPLKKASKKQKKKRSSTLSGYDKLNPNDKAQLKNTIELLQFTTSIAIPDIVASFEGMRSRYRNLVTALQCRTKSVIRDLHVTDKSAQSEAANRFLTQQEVLRGGSEFQSRNKGKTGMMPGGTIKFDPDAPPPVVESTAEAELEAAAAAEVTPDTEVQSIIIVKDEIVRASSPSPSPSLPVLKPEVGPSVVKPWKSQLGKRVRRNSTQKAAVEVDLSSTDAYDTESDGDGSSATASEGKRNDMQPQLGLGMGYVPAPMLNSNAPGPTPRSPRGMVLFVQNPNGFGHTTRSPRVAIPSDTTNQNVMVQATSSNPTPAPSPQNSISGVLSPPMPQMGMANQFPGMNMMNWNGFYGYPTMLPYGPPPPFGPWMGGFNNQLQQ